MKIAHVTQYAQFQQFHYQDFKLATKQSEMGHEVYTVTSSKYAPVTRWQQLEKTLGKRELSPGIYKVANFIEYRLPVIAEYNGQVLVCGLNKALNMIQPDIVHAHGSLVFMSILAILLKNKNGYKLVCDDHMIPDYGSMNLTKKAYIHFYKNYFFPKLLLKKVDYFLPIAPDTLEWLQEELLVPRDKIELIPLGADISLFKRSESERTLIRQMLGISNDDILVIYAGSMRFEKRIDLLIYAILPLMKEYSNLKLILLGRANESFETNIKQFIKKRRLSDKIVFHNSVEQDELFKYYSAADIAVWPGSPSITVFEALSTSLPVITTNSKWFSNIVKDGIALSFNSGDEEGLRSCLKRLIQDTKLRRNIGNKARKVVEEKYSWRAIAKRTLRVYEKILNQ